MIKISFGTQAIRTLDKLIENEPKVSRAYQRRIIAALKKGDMELFETDLKLLEALLDVKDMSLKDVPFQESNPVSRREFDRLQEMLKQYKSDFAEKEKTIFSKMFQSPKRKAKQNQGKAEDQGKSTNDLIKQNMSDITEMTSPRREKVTKLSIQGHENPHIIVQKEIGEEEQKRRREELARNASANYNQTLESGVLKLREERVKEERSKLQSLGSQERLKQDIRFTPHSVTDNPQDFPPDLRSVLSPAIETPRLKDEFKKDDFDIPQDSFFFSEMLKSSNEELKTSRLENVKVKRSILQHLIHTVTTVKREGGKFSDLMTNEMELLKRQLIELEQESERELVETSEVSAEQLIDSTSRLSGR